MRDKIKLIGLMITLLFGFNFNSQSQDGSSCIDSTPFCSGSTMTFPNNYGQSPGVTPSMGCLGSTPNPIWYHLQIDQPGSLQLNLSQTVTNWLGNPSPTDIDFAMWGPFTDLGTGCGQIISGNLPPIQCSYSASATETIGIGLPGGSGSGASTPPDAQSGQYYIILMTNYNGSSGTISLEQTGGDGSTDCSILKVCDIDAGNDFIVCEGESVTLNATGTSGGNITWNNSIVNNQSFTPILGTTEYIVTNTLSDTVCYDNMNITVNPIPIVNAGNDTIICDGESVTLNGVGPGLSWNNGITNGVPFNPTTTLTYTLTGTENGCNNTDEVLVTVNPNPIPNFISDYTDGCNPFVVNFEDNTLGGVNCVWNLGDGTIINECDNISHTYTSDGSYNVSLSVTDINGCVGNKTINNYIIVTPSPISDFSATPSVTSVSNTLIEFDNNSINGIDYIWNFGDNSITETEFSPFHIYPSDAGGEYVVTLIAINGECRDTSKMLINIKDELIFFVPNSFTPNGVNKKFTPIFTSGYDPLGYTLLIYNRWGEIIFESNDTSVGWDGTYNGKLVKTGVYVWIIDFKETMSDKRHNYQGNINVLR